MLSRELRESDRLLAAPPNCALNATLPVIVDKCPIIGCTWQWPKATSYILSCDGYDISRPGNWASCEPINNCTVFVRLRSSVTRRAAVPHGMTDLLQRITVTTAELRGAWTLASLVSVLAPMPTLLTLSITEGALTAVPPPQVWSGLTRLESLNLGYNQISAWDPDALAPLNSTLETLVMTQNKLREITPETFRSTQKLLTLDLSDNFLETLPTGLLKHTPRLSTLTIVNNNLITLESLCRWSVVISVVPLLFYLLIDRVVCERIFLQCSSSLYPSSPPHTYSATFPRLSPDAGLHSPTVALQGSTMLRIVNLNVNNIKDIASNVFYVQPLLQDLNLRGNYLSRLAADVLSNCPSLRFLDLSFNAFTLADSDFYRKAPSLQSLDISDNEITTIIGKVSSTLPNLKALDLSNNRLKNLDGTLRGTTRLEFLDLSYNELSTMDNSVLDMPALTKLYARFNTITSIDSYIFLRNKYNLTYLDLSSNGLVNFNTSVLGELCPKLVALVLNSNRLTSVEVSALG